MRAWVWRRETFDAAHQLPKHKGLCKRLHGHTYYVELGVEGPIDPETGMVVDILHLKEFLETVVVALFDHANLNERLPGIETTAENIAVYTLHRAVDYFDGRLDSPVIKVRVFETLDSWVEVQGDSTLESKAHQLHSLEVS